MSIKEFQIKKFVKAELSGWKKIEVIGLAVVFSVILINAFFVKDSIVAVISAMCGILYSTIAGKGKISCYIFGLAGTGCYGWLAYENGLWGNLILYMCYYLPMQLAGIFAWRKHLKESTKEIIKEKLTKQQLFRLILLILCACIGAVFLIRYFKGSSPLFDGVTTVLSVFGMYLTVKRSIEQWIIWMIVNGLSALMWLNLVLQGAKTFSTLIMWLVYFVLSIYFYINWRRELECPCAKEI